MRKTFYLILASMLAFGCKKNGPTDCKLISTQDMTTSLRLNYEYDAQGRVTRIASTTPSTDPVSTQYFNDSIVVKQGTNLITTFYLNSSGLATSSKTRYVINPNGLAIDNVYTYNSEGYMTNSREIFSQVYNGIILRDTTDLMFTIQNGNIVKFQSLHNGTPDQEINYEYSNQPAKSNIAFLFKPWYPSTYLGKASNNLASVTKDKIGSVVSNFTYEFDSKGNVVSRKETYLAPSSSFTTKYEYQCK